MTWGCLREVFIGVQGAGHGITDILISYYFRHILLYVDERPILS